MAEEPPPTVNPDTVRTFVTIAQSGVEVFDFEDPETHFVFTVKSQTPEQKEARRLQKERRKVEEERLRASSGTVVVEPAAGTGTGSTEEVTPRTLALSQPVQTVPGMREHPKTGKIYGGGMKTVAAKYPMADDVVAQQQREREEIRLKLGGGKPKTAAVIEASTGGTSAQHASQGKK